MTWEEYCYAQYGYWMRVARQTEPIRKLWYTLLAANSKDRPARMEYLWPLITDPPPKKIDPRELAERKQRALNFIEVLNNNSLKKVEEKQPSNDNLSGFRQSKG